MGAERRFTGAAPASIRLERREGKPTVLTGYAAVFYRAGDPGTQYELWEGCVERILPGAFSRAIREGDDCRALFNHDANHILGRVPGTCRLSEDETGLRFEIDLPDTQMGRDLATSIERGDLSGCSFSFRPERVVWIEDGDLEIRQIEGVRLYDVGPVTYPAYTATTVALRSEDAGAAKTEHDLWRSESRSEADAVAVRARLVETNLTS